MTQVRSGSQRIVYVWDSEYPWDVRVEKICLAMSSAGYGTHITARNRRWSELQEHLPEGQVHRMKPWRAFGRSLDGALGFPAFFSPRWWKLIKTTVTSTSAELLLVRDLPLCPTAIAVGRQLGVPVMLDMAEHYPAIMRELWTSRRHRPLDFLVRNPAVVEQIERYCLSRVDHVLTVVEESSARLISLGVEPDRISVVGNTPPAHRPLRTGTARVDSDANTPLDVVYLGLLELSRGVTDLIDACKAMKGGNPAIRILVLGNGRDEQIIRQHAKTAGLTDEDIVFFGYVPYAEALERVAAADIGILPIHVNDHMNTTIPNKLFDYMSVSVPVITSDSIPSARVVIEEGCGEVFRERDIPSLIGAIRRLADPRERRRKGEAGRVAIVNKYNWERDAAVLVETVTRVIARGARGKVSAEP